MNYATLPGFGDPATWGGRSPEPECNEGTVTFPMTIGLTGARVTVVARSNGHELDDINNVLLEGIDILPALDVQVHEDIRNHYERHAEAINRASREAAQEDAL